MLKLNRWTYTFVLFVGFGSAASAQTSCPDPMPARPSPAQLVACLSELKTELAQQREDDQLASSLAIPAGAVLAFNRECPLGWGAFKEGTGRFLVGAGDQFHPAYKQWIETREDDAGGETGKGIPRGLQTYELSASGGAEHHILTNKELPSHRHGLAYLSISTDLGFKDGATGLNIPYFDVPKGQAAGRAQVEHYPAENGVTEEGGNQSHDNIPPYYAINYCIKSE